VPIILFEHRFYIGFARSKFKVNQFDKFVLVARNKSNKRSLDIVNVNIVNRFKRFGRRHTALRLAGGYFTGGRSRAS